MTEEAKRQIRSWYKDSEAGQAQAEKWIALLEEKWPIEFEDEGKTPCEYPMSNFYTYQKDVPPNVRVSTPEDCESCEEYCTVKNCIITENEGERTEKEKKCESCCPYCSSGDIDYGVSFSVSDEYYHQRGTCLSCNKCFTEVSKMVYQSTIVNGE